MCLSHGNLKQKKRKQDNRFAEQRAEKFNATHKMKRFQKGKRVSFKTNPVNKSQDNTATKFIAYTTNHTGFSKRLKKSHLWYMTEKTKRFGNYRALSLRRYFCNITNNNISTDYFQW